MEIRSKTMVGLPVFTTTHGEKLGQVKDYIFHPESKGILAFVVSKGKPFGEEWLLPIANMKSMGVGAVTVEESSALIAKEEDPKLCASLKRMANIVGIRVMTADGTLLGTVSEFTMDTKSGAVLSLSLGSGWANQMLHGKKYIDAESIEVFGTDVILAKDGAIPLSATAKPSKESEKEARSHTLWNQGVTKVKGRAQLFKSKEAKAVFPARKEPPQEEDKAAVLTEKKGKTTIGFQESKHQ